MNCDEVQLELDALVRGELSPSAAEVVRAHLAGCAACRAEAAFAERLDRDLAATRPAPPAIDPARLADRVLGPVRAASSRRDRSERTRRARPSTSFVGARGLGPALALAASVAVAVGVSAWFALRTPAAGPAPAVARDDPAPTPAPEPVTEAAPRPTSSPVSPPELPELPELPERPDELETPGVATEVPTPAPVVTESPERLPPPPPTTPPTAPTAPRVEAEEVPALAGVLLTSRGRAEASTDDGRTWSALRAGDSLAPGARLRAPRGDGGVVAVISPGGPVAAAAAIGARVVLAPGTEVALARDVVRVAAGTVYVQADARVLIAAANVRVPVERADAEVELARGGDQVRVWARAGEVGVGDVRLSPGQQVTIDERGRMGRVRQDAEGPPGWVVAANRPRQVIYHEPLDHWQRVGARRLGRELPRPHRGVVAGEAPDDDPRARQVMWGKSQPEGGLFHAQAGARLRVKLRVARPTTVTLQVMDHSIPDNVHAEVQVARAGLWTELDVALERLDDNARQGRRVSPGDLLGYVTVRAAADGAGPVELEVDEVTAYVP